MKKNFEKIFFWYLKKIPLIYWMTLINVCVCVLVFWKKINKTKLIQAENK